MKLGLLSQWYDPEPGGGAVPGVLARGLAHGGHDVKVLTGFPNYPLGSIYPGYRQRINHVEHPISGVEVRRLPLFPSHNNRSLQRVLNYGSFAVAASLLGARYLRDCEAAWVYNSPATIGPAASKLARRFDVPFLLHIMDVWPDSVSESGMLQRGRTRQLAEAVLNRLVATTYRDAAAVAVTSPGQMELLMSRGVAGSKLHYIPVWADESIYFEQARKRELLPIPARSANLVLMYAGALGHVQALHHAIEAVAAAEHCGVHLVIAGSGVAEPRLRALADQLATRNVHFMGQQSASAMGALGSAADVHLVSLADTPLLRVTMPSKVQAIQALGRPIVACCAGDAAEMINAAGAGWVVPQGDVPALAECLRVLAQGPSEVLADAGRRARGYYETTFSRARAISRVTDVLYSIAH